MKVRSGTYRKLPSGRWQARVTTQDGRRIKGPTTFATKTDARLWVASVSTDEAAGLRVDPDAGRITLEEYAWRWLSDRVGLAPRTKEIYESQLRLHVLPLIDTSVPALGRLELMALSPEVVRRWYRAMQEHRPPSVAPKCYTRLRQVLGQAVDDDLLVKNPCRVRRGGVERHAEQRFASLPELLKLASVVPKRYRALVITAGLAGLRRGELMALRRGDVDLEAATITVRRKRLTLANGTVIEDLPKSAAGLRTVSLPAVLVQELRCHLEAFADGGSQGYVFTKPTGGPIDENNFRKRVWLPATEAVGMVGLRLHDLRHTAGTLAAQTGASTKELMARLGHASMHASLIYQHAAPDRDRVIAERLDAMAAESGWTGVPRITVVVTERVDPSEQSKLHAD